MILSLQSPLRAAEDPAEDDTQNEVTSRQTLDWQIYKFGKLQSFEVRILFNLQMSAEARNIHIKT